MYDDKYQIKLKDKHGRNNVFIKTILNDNIYTNYKGTKININPSKNEFKIQTQDGHTESFRKGVFNDYVGNKGSSINNGIYKKYSSKQKSVKTNNTLYKKIFCFFIISLIIGALGIHTVVDIIMFFISILFG